jgi:hypothetical protein
MSPLFLSCEKLTGRSDCAWKRRGVNRAVQDAEAAAMAALSGVAALR